MNKLSDRVRPNCEAAPWVIDEIKRLEAALESKAAPVGEREAFEAEIAALIKDRADIARKADGEYRNFYLQCAWQGFQAGSAYQRAQQPQSAEAEAYIPVDRATGEQWHPVKVKGTGAICDYIPLYTCIGKGGEYRYLGTAIGAGDSRGELVEVYQERSGQLFHRTPEDFIERMAPIDAEGNRNDGINISEAPAGFQRQVTPPPAPPASMKPLPHWYPCNPGCDPELNGRQDWHCHCEAARAAFAAVIGVKP